MLRYPRVWVLFAVAATVFPASIANADEKSAAKVLRGKGLRKVGASWVLADELELSKRIKRFGRFKKALKDAVEQRDALEKQIQADRQMIRALYKERMRCNRELERADDFRDYNKVRAKMNELTDRIKLLHESIAEAQGHNPARSALAEKKDAYMAELMAMRNLVSQTRSGYAALAEDAQVQAALSELSTLKEREFKLGPLPVFKRRIKQLEKLETVVQTDSITLQRRGGVFLIDTIINSEHRHQMIFDTGASFVTVPHDLAIKIGLHPTEADPTITLRVADGRTIEAKLMTLKSLQVGKAVVENITCTVLPSGMKDAPSLLGGTFLHHFVYKINPETSTLMLTRIELVGKKTSKKPPR
ncbi:MAG: retroviral-like aspartic protease family protein [Phycisphaerae bacterium]|nr:retroviral-like aspartic protease family protein [Phycisphaerae bacterium]